MQQPVFSYATEDFRLLPMAFSPAHLKKVLCICSGGETMLNLAAIGAEHVVAVDFNEGQLALAKLKLEARKRMSQNSFLDLLGVGTGSSLLAFEEIKPFLPESEQMFWQHSCSLSRGALWCGSLARYFLLVGRALRLALGSQQFATLLALFGSQQIEGFIEDIFKKWHIKVMMNVLLSRALLRRFYPEHGWERLNREETPRQFCLRKLTQLANHVPIGENPVILPMLTGSFTDALRPQYFDQLTVTTRVEFVPIDLREIEKGRVGRDFTAFALCNVVDWLTLDELKRVLCSLRSLSDHNARLLMYSRSNHDWHLRVSDLPWKVEHEESIALTNADRTGYHQNVFLLSAI